jgi:uncharacterized protein
MSTENEKTVKIRDTTAIPGPLGLLGFGLTTVLLNVHNAGFIPISSMILAMGFAYGGIAQIMASAMEFKKGNTFATVAFGSYGLFWWSLVLILILPQVAFFNTSGGSALQAADPMSLGFYLFMWGVFTLGMFVASLKHSRGVQVVFISLAILFFLLAAGKFTGNPMITIIAGYEGIFTGAAAIYVGLGEVINDAYQKPLVPL